MALDTFRIVLSNASGEESVTFKAAPMYVGEVAAYAARQLSATDVSWKIGPVFAIEAGADGDIEGSYTDAAATVSRWAA